MKYQRPELDALPRRCVGGRGRVGEGRVRCEAGPPVGLGVVALEQEPLVRLHLRDVEPAVPRIEGYRIGLTDAMLIDEIGWDQALGIDAQRIADGQRRVQQWPADRAPDVDDL